MCNMDDIRSSMLHGLSQLPTDVGMFTDFVLIRNVEDGMCGGASCIE